MTLRDHLLAETRTLGIRAYAISVAALLVAGGMAMSEQDPRIVVAVGLVPILLAWVWVVVKLRRIRCPRCGQGQPDHARAAFLAQFPFRGHSKEEGWQKLDRLRACSACGLGLDEQVRPQS